MVDQPNPQFGPALRRLRIAAGMSQEVLSEHSGVSVRGISDLERGHRKTPRLETIRMLADALELDDDSRSQLIAASRPQVSRPLTSRPARRRYNLPHTLTGLVGRRKELSEIRSMLMQPATRLLTLTGPGGTGKTRLALQVCEDLDDDFAHGFRFVPLVPLIGADRVVPAIAEVLGVKEVAGVPLEDTLAAQVREMETLLLLDNFEHVVDAAPAVNALLASCPRLKVLVTSRSALNLRAEHVYEVAPLGLPESGADITVEDVHRYDALALFVDRARMADARFAVSPDNIESIHAICRQVDGLPLAIELAAARIRTVSPQQLEGLLSESLPVLTGGARDLPQRHQTLQDTIAWSYDLLDDGARSLLRRLAVFAGGWTLEAAQAVASDLVAPATGTETLDRIETLIAHSLVRRVDTAGAGSRLGMLQTIREFGVQQLSVHGETTATRQRHADFFLNFMREQQIRDLSPDEATRLRSIDIEYDNIRVALRWLVEHQHAAGALAMCSLLNRYWVVRGFISEGLGWTEAVLALPEDTPDIGRATTLYSAAMLACHQNNLDLAGRLAEESLALGEALADNTVIVYALHALGLVAQLQEDYSRASATYDRCLTLERQLDHPKLNVTLGNLAQVAFHLGDTERAIELLAECIERDRTAGAISMLAVHQTDLGLILVECGQGDRAWTTFYEALRIHQEIGDVRMMITTIEGLASIAVRNTDPARAARLYGAVEAWREHARLPREDSNRWNYGGYVQQARSLLAEPAFDAVWNEGRLMSPEQAVALALAGDRPAPSERPRPRAGV